MVEASGRRAAGAIKSLVIGRDLQFECARVLTLLVPILMYGNKTMLWEEKERSRIWAIQMDILRDFLDIRRMDRVPIARIRELCGVTKEVHGRTNEGVLIMEGMENERIPKKVYIGECAGSCSVGRPRKRWIDTVKVC